MKIKFVFAILFVSQLMFVNAFAIEINPPILEINGESGDFILQSIEIYNDRDKETVVNITVVGISNYYLPKSTYVLKPYERKTITIGITISGSSNGFITYEYNGEILTQIVSINAEKNVIIFPQNPKAGTSVAIITTSDEKANGFLFVSETGRQYPIILSGMPITFINISKEDYGNAMIVLIWEDKEVTYHYLNITKVKSTEENELLIDFGGDKTIKYGSTRIITLKYGNEPVKGSFIIVSPDGNQILKETNNLGQITLTFDKAGIWTFIANYNDEAVSDTITVKKGTVSFYVPKKVYVGEEITIEVSENNGNFTILTPKDEYIKGGFTHGIISFTPDEAGEYEITITCDGSENKDIFRVYHKPKIIFKKGFFETNKIKSGEVYDIYVIDANTQDIIEDLKYVNVFHNGVYEYINLVNGVGTFKPKSGHYTISISRDDKNFIDAYSTYITVYASSSSKIPFYIYIIVIILFIIAFILYIYKKGIISFGKLPKLER